MGTPNHPNMLTKPRQEGGAVFVQDPWTWPHPAGAADTACAVDIGHELSLGVRPAVVAPTLGGASYEKKRPVVR
jgi:hypothetical protein